MIIELARRRFSVEEYRRMARAGILTGMDHVELIEGEVIQLAPTGSRHDACVARLGRLFGDALAGRAHVWPERPVRLPGDTETRPDVTLLRPRPAADAGHPAQAEDVRLLVEVADVSYRYDRGVKLPLYARAGIPEVWIVDLTCEAVEVHRQPGSRGYRSMQTLTHPATLTPQAFADVALAAADILPPP